MDSRKRIDFLIALTLLGVGVTVARLFYFQAIKTTEFSARAEQSQLKKWELPARRGKIFIKDGASLVPAALNETVTQLYLDPTFIDDKARIVAELSAVLGISADELTQKVNAKSSYVIVRKELTTEQAARIKQKKLKGVILQDRLKRVYPEGAFLAHVLGFVDDEGTGRYGVEEQYDTVLRGTSGLVRARTDAAGVPLISEDTTIKKPVDGSDIVLTIDRNIQIQAEERLKDSVSKFKAQGGSVVVMDPKTGAILAMASLPAFDPNAFSESKDYSAFINPAIASQYEPGSIFKAITMGVGLDAGVIRPDTKYTDTGDLFLDGYHIKNSDRKAHGVQTMTQALEESLNTGSSWVLAELGGGKIIPHGKGLFYDYIERFGFTKATGIDLPGESGGFVNTPQSVNSHTYATMTFGQSISVTPLQFTRAVGAIANNGTLMKPRIVEGVRRNGTVQKQEVTPGTQIIKSESAQLLTNMMVSVVVSGHGKRAGVKGYRVAGKTGTAQIPKKNGGYEEGANIGSFVGFAPAEKPVFVALVKIDRPKVEWAESSAAPVFGQLAQFLLKYHQLPPSP